MLKRKKIIIKLIFKNRKRLRETNIQAGKKEVGGMQLHSDTEKVENDENIKARSKTGS